MQGEEVLQKVVTMVFSPLYQLLVVLAFLYFLYGGFMFIKDMEEPTAKNTGKQHLLWGTVGLFIILSIGGMLEAVNRYLGGLFTF